MALARSRRLRITEMKDKDGSRWKLEVLDPKLVKPHTTFIARSLIDCERIKRTFMQQYRIPEQLVEKVEQLVSDTPDTSTEAKNASGDKRKSSTVPQPRKAVLEFKVADVDTGAKEGSGDVS
jgi:hypothetical protein